MSILIQGMDMPKNCAYCPLSEYRNTSLGQILDCKRIGTVGTVLRDTHDVLNRRHPNCPLIELPPHGRLIDADKFEFEMNDKLLVALTEKYGEEEAQKGLHFSFRDCISNIQFQPTVIEAEGEA